MSDKRHLLTMLSRLDTIHQEDLDFYEIEPNAYVAKSFEDGKAYLEIFPITGGFFRVPISEVTHGEVFISDDIVDEDDEEEHPFLN